jgi:hypothetical protein
VPFTFENRVGRLVEITISGILTADEAQAFRTKMFLTLSGLPGRGVLCGDMRSCSMFSSEISEKMVTMLKQDSPKVERSAFLVSDSALSRQIERIVADAAREAKAAGRQAPPRQAFRDIAAAHAWLGEVLNDAERARLSEIFPAS